MPSMPRSMTASTFEGRGFRQVFAEEFDRASIDRPGTVDWNHTLPGNVRSILAYTGEKQLYVDKAFKTAGGYMPGIDPFAMNGGVVSITAQKTTAEVAAKIGGFRYTSGLLTSYDNMQLTYGYIEMRAEMPKGKGFWPAFFLRGADQKVQGEIDVVEFLGHMPNTLFQTLHYKAGSDAFIKDKTVRATVADMTAGMHTYGVDWNPQKIAFYFDGRKMGEITTPESLKIPMYMLANFAVGGGWAGEPDGSTPWPGKYDIDYIRVWQDEASLASRSKIGGAGVDVLSGADGNDKLTGQGGNDILLGGRGNDVLDGGSGNDRINAGFGDDTLIGGTGTDTLLGGKGNDTYVLEAAGDSVVEFAQGGIDTVVTSGSAFSLYGNLENLTHAGASAFKGVGNMNANVLTGGSGADRLIGGAGNDTLVGGSGSDDLSAGSGNDRLVAGAGNDTLFGDAGADTFVFMRADGAGRELVKDFRPGIDDLDLRDFGVNTLAEAKAVTVDVTGGTLIKLGTETIMLQGVKESMFTSHDFVA